MLNVHTTPTRLSLNPTELRPFLPNYQDNFQLYEIKKLDNILTTLKANPKLISINFETSDMVRLHNKFYVDFVKFLNRTFHSNEPFDLSDIPIYYYPQCMSFPNLNANVNKYPFQINGINKLYDLKAVAVLLTLERNIRLGNISKMGKLFPNKSYKSCLNNMLIQSRILLQERYPYVLMSWYRRHLSVIRSEFGKICEYLIIEGKDQFINGDSDPIHAFALIFRDNKWIMMNDHFSAAIADINKFNLILKEETISGILLEERTTTETRY
ncbi:hypothetical protein SNEBB_000469 [Seison nebaliae]|nr:hypothetical protein SNEBB_000469 [Seison nebaliae]